jgi:hypothetical protein
MMLKQAKILGLAIAVVLSLSPAAMAREHGGALNSKQHGYEHGYRDGYQHGREDRAHGMRYDYHSEDYRLADRGYEPYMGEHDDFQHGYRDGYKAGYDDAFYGRPGRWDQVYGIDNSYDPYARTGNDSDDDVYVTRRYGYRDVSYDIGYHDGVAMGERDRSNGKDFRPQKNERHEDADHGYRKEYGDKKLYKQQYRDGFVRGYEDGYGRWR